MSTQTDKIRAAINCGRVLRDTFGGNVGGGPDVFAEALAALSELEAQPSVEQRVEEIMEAFEANHEACVSAWMESDKSFRRSVDFRARLSKLLDQHGAPNPNEGKAWDRAKAGGGQPVK